MPARQNRRRQCCFLAGPGPSCGHDAADDILYVTVPITWLSSPLFALFALCRTSIGGRSLRWSSRYVWRLLRLAGRCLLSCTRGPLPLRTGATWPVSLRTLTALPLRTRGPISLGTCGPLASLPRRPISLRSWASWSVSLLTLTALSTLFSFATTLLATPSRSSFAGNIRGLYR